MSIKDTNCEVLIDVASIQKRWKNEHFDYLPNVDTCDDPTILAELPVNSRDEQTPNFLQEEVWDASTN